MRKNFLISTASSLAITALSAAAMAVVLPGSANAVDYCFSSGACTTNGGGTQDTVGTSGTPATRALSASAKGSFETGTTAANTAYNTYTVANGATAGAVNSTTAATGANGVGTVTLTASGGTTAIGAAGSSTNYLGVVNVNGTGGAATAANFGGVLGTSALNLTSTGSGTALTTTVTGAANINALTISGATSGTNTATFTGGVTAATTAVSGTNTISAGAASNLGAVTSTAGTTTFSGAGNTTLTSLSLDATSTANINGTGTNTITTLTGVTGSTTNVNQNATVTTLTGTAGNLGAISVAGGKTLTATNGFADARGWTFTSTGNTGATGSKVTTAGANNLNFNGGAVTFNAANTAAATNKTMYTYATATGTGTVTGPSTFTATNTQTGYTYLSKVASGSQSAYVVQLQDSLYKNASANVVKGGSSASTRSAIASVLENAIAGSAQDTGAAATYLTALNTANGLGTAAGNATAAKILDQSAVQTNVQVMNNLSNGFMGVVQNRTGVAQGTRASAGSTGVSAGDISTGRALWAEAYGSVGREDTRNGIAGFDASNAGLALGYEKKFSPALVGGVAVSYSAGRFESNQAGVPKNTTSNSYQALVYGSEYLTQYDKNWYVEGQLGGGYHTFDEGNTFVAGGAQASGTYNAWGYFGRFGTGYDIKTASPVTVTPFASLSYSGMKYDSYTETGAGGLNRNVDSTNANLLTGKVGTRLAWQGLAYNTTKITPEVSLAYLNDLSQSGVDATSSFVGGGKSSTFKTTGQKLARDGFTAGTGLTLASANGWSVDAKYEYENRDSFNGHSGTLRAKYSF